MGNVDISYFSFNDIMAMKDIKTRNTYLKEYRKLLITIGNKLYMEASRYKDFSFSQEVDNLTFRQMIEELKTFLQEKGYRDEEISALVIKGKQR